MPVIAKKSVSAQRAHSLADDLSAILRQSGPSRGEPLIVENQVAQTKSVHAAVIWDKTGFEPLVLQDVKQMKAMSPRIMYIEDKSNGLSGPGRVGRVRFSKSGKSLYYSGRTLQTLSGGGFKANYFDVATGAEFWVSGCKKRGGDRLYGGIVDIDDDVREEYWCVIRRLPQNKDQRTYRC